MNELRSASVDAARAADKGPSAFRTISEVAEDLDLPQHVLRFWETRFTQIKPLKRGGGRRYYRPDDIDLLRGIRHLLYGQGYTIRGVQRILKQDGPRFVQSIGRGERTVAPPQPSAADEAAQPDADSSILARAPQEDLAPDRLTPPPEAQWDTDAMPGPGPVGLSPADVQRLHAALDELLECERVLAALRIFDDPPEGPV